MNNFWSPFFALVPLVLAYASYRFTVRAFGGGGREPKVGLILSLLVTLLSTATQPGFAILWFFGEQKGGSTLIISLKARVAALLVTSASLVLLLCGLALALAQLASQFYQGAVTEILQVCYSACFTMLGTAVLPLPGSALLLSFARFLPVILSSPVVAVAAFSLGIYGLTDLSARSQLPEWVFNEAACFLNTMMCLN